MRRRRLDNPVLILGTFLAFATGLLFYLRSDLSTALAVVAGLQVTLLTMQIETLLRRHREELAETRQARLIANLERLEWLPELMDRITSSIWRVDQAFPGTQIIAAARSYLERCANDLKELERGHLRIEWEDIDLVLAQTRASTKTLRATSVQAVDLTWWLSRPGRRYWRTHLEALARGVSVERVFIYHNWSDELQSLVQEQIKAGVKVYRVDYTALPARLKTDMIIWDEVCGYETQLNAAGDGYRNFFTLDHQDIRRMCSDYNAIVSQADPLFDEVSP